jgi:Tfp pilus assembly protein PilN
MPYHDLNLASRPYRNYRVFLLCMGALYLLTIGITWINAGRIARKLTLTGETQTRIRNLEDQIAALKKENARVSTVLGAINFKKIGTAADEMNGLIAQRAFSWSRILGTLEHVMPEDVRLTFLGTSADKSGTIVLRLSCLSTGRDGMVRTVEALQVEPMLTDVLPLNFSDQEAGGPMGVKFDIEARYIGGLP